MDGCWSCQKGECSMCPRGSYRSEAGAVIEAECLLCPEGTVADASGQPVCALCPAGKYAADDDELSDPDGVGTSVGGTQCAPCPAGRFGREAGSSSCEACDQGTTSSPGSSSCEACQSGHFAEGKGSPECKSCEVGRATAKKGSTSCDICAAGSYSGMQGSPSCTLCPEGSFNDKEGEGVCQPCDFASVAPTNGSTQCQACATTYTTTERGMTACDGCVEGYYRDPTQRTAALCLRCPEDAYCAGDSIPGATLLPVPLAGYWSNRSELALVHHIHACPRGEAVCHGGVANISGFDGKYDVVNALCWSPANLTSDACTDDNILCMTGSLGPLCGAVIKGEYTWSTLDQKLSECPESSATESLIKTVIGIVVAIAGGLFYARRKEIHAFLLRVDRSGLYKAIAGIIEMTFENGR